MCAPTLAGVDGRRRAGPAGQRIGSGAANVAVPRSRRHAPGGGRVLMEGERPSPVGCVSVQKNRADAS
ncbi:MAG: hypothetical protein M3R38_02830 [Actinomycetota bacterium]|nr:hypothetical protein [Actinomycetota bacterium]